MYLLYLDESGTQAGSPVFVLAGIAVQEQDVWHLQQRLDKMLQRKLPQGLDPQEFELHAAEIKSPIKKKSKSNWAQVPLARRLEVLRATFGAVSGYEALDSRLPFRLFGAVVDQSYSDREQRAYEEVLHKFDEMLTRQASVTGIHERGIVIHDRRVLERDVQAWVSLWRRVAGRIGRLTHIVDVPLFADSQASRLIQAADFVAWGLNRSYGDLKDSSWIKALWPKFDNSDGVMHGLIHVRPNYRSCTCPPCASRNTATR